MFIHYGLYSIPGGVFQGKPVRQGYSEQILTFGIGFSDWYERYLHDFKAEQFNATEIVALAKSSGMRSIVLTSKHHDGFCLWNTATTKYNAYVATPAHRDLVGEMAEACHSAKMPFGLYFSLIDWHYPYAQPFSSHNADLITPQHHEYNKAQITELLTRYGRVDELWFDMGSLSPQQSKEMYELVHKLQPECLVSGRLGNDCADFAVMPDNAVPEYVMDMPWQTAASIFPETWGYRSWQKRDSLEKKVQEKITTLIQVVTRGGKYLLNIGPKGDGGVVPFERDLLLKIGQRIKPIEEAIYNTKPAPFAPLATLSEDECTVYFFLKPNDVTPFSTPPFLSHPISATLLRESKELILSQRTDHSYQFNNLPQRKDWDVLKMVFEEPIKVDHSKEYLSTTSLSPINATPLLAHASVDYYGSYQSIVGYEWRVYPIETSLSLSFSKQEKGKVVELNDQKELSLIPTDSIVHCERWKSVHPIAPLKHYLPRGLFGSFKPDTAKLTVSPLMWTDTLRSPIHPHRSIGYIQSFHSPKAEVLPLQITFTGGMMLYLNGRYIDAAFAKEEPQTLFFLLPFQKGENRLAVKCYNHTKSQMETAYLIITPLKQYTEYRMTLPLKKGSSHIIIKRPYRFPLATPAHLSNIKVDIEP